MANNTGPCHSRVAKTLLNTQNITLLRIEDADAIGYHNITVLNTNIRPFQTLRKKSLHASGLPMPTLMTSCYGYAGDRPLSY